MGQSEEIPHDPNRRNVVVISDDEDNGDDFGFDASEDDEYGWAEERSSYFEQPADVQAFNDRRKLREYVF